MGGAAGLLDGLQGIVDSFVERGKWPRHWQRRIFDFTCNTGAHGPSGDCQVAGLPYRSLASLPSHTDFKGIPSFPWTPHLCGVDGDVIIDPRTTPLLRFPPDLGETVSSTIGELPAEPAQCVNR